MNVLVKAWIYLSGKKTVTAAIIKAAADILTAAGMVNEAALVDQIGNALLALGLAHKGMKKAAG